jgi:CheY-like chemotaxis protein
VLVVDDDRDTAGTLERVLGAAGFRVAAVPSADAAATVALREHVDVLLGSFRGAGIASTTGLVRTLRSRPEEPLRDAAVIAVVDDPADARFGLAAEADAVLVRPVPAERLADAVTEVAALDPRRRRRRRAERAGSAGSAAQSGALSE